MDYFDREATQIAEERARIILRWQSSSRNGNNRSDLNDLQLIGSLQQRTMELVMLITGGGNNYTRNDLREAYLATEQAIMVRLGWELMKPSNNVNNNVDDDGMEGLERVVVIDEGDVCAVCQEEIEVGEEARKMECFHTFHAVCVKEWVRINPTCPLCRFEISSSTVINGAKRRTLSPPSSSSSSSSSAGFIID